MKNKFWLVIGLIFVVSNMVLAQTARKTVTNEDLEKFKQQREKAEADYRAKYKELGMPSPEELEKRNAEDQRWKEEYSRAAQANKQQDQDYWQTRSNTLRYEIYNINAQINYVNNQIARLSNQNPNVVTPQQLGQVAVVPYAYYGGQGNFARQRNGSQINTANQATSVQTAINAAAANPNPFYGTPLASSGVKLVIGQSNSSRRGGYYRPYGYGGYVVPYVANNNSSNRDELVSRLQYLGQVRAGLVAQWNNLVDEAYRAGVRLTF